MRDVRIAGVGLTPHGHFPELDWLHLAQAAVADAKAERSLPQDCSLYVGSAAMPILTGDHLLAAALAEGLGTLPSAALDVGGAEAAGTLALRAAWLEVASGACDCALAVGVEFWSAANPELQSAALASITGDGDVPRDVIAGILANAYADLVDDLPQALDAVARKNRTNAIHHPKAFHRLALDPGSLRDAPTVAEPLTSAHVADLVDGAAAVLLVASEQELGRSASVRLAAISASSAATASTRRSGLLADATSSAAQSAYLTAGFGPEAIDVAEVFDAYAVLELTSLEALQLCESRQAAAVTLRGETGFESQRPVNPSGGLLGLGHALGVGGLAQFVSIAQQVAGTAGVMQVPQVRRGLAHSLGGLGTLSVVSLLERVDG